MKYLKRKRSLSNRIKRNLAIVLCSFVFYLINLRGGDMLTEYINENSIIQALLFYLTVEGILSLFFPFFLRKETKDSSLLSLKLKKNIKLQRKKENEDLKKIASIG